MRFLEAAEALFMKGELGDLRRVGRAIAFQIADADFYRLATGFRSGNPSRHHRHESFDGSNHEVLW